MAGGLLLNKKLEKNSGCLLWQFVRPGHIDRYLSAPPHGTRTLLPFQATCALKRIIFFPRFWLLRDDTTRKAAQMVGQVSTRAPLVLVVCLALLRSSAGRRRLNKKEKREKRSHFAWAATLPGRPSQQKNTRSRVALSFVSGGNLRRNAKGRMRLAVFAPANHAPRSPAWPRHCKGEEGGSGRRLLSLPARGAQEEENTKHYYLLLCIDYSNATTTLLEPIPPFSAKCAVLLVFVFVAQSTSYRCKSYVGF